MAVPSSKEELLAAIATTFDTLLADLLKVPHERVRARTLEGHAAGTVMSPADLVSYLIPTLAVRDRWLLSSLKGRAGFHRFSMSQTHREPV